MRLQDRLAYGQVYGVAPERKGPPGSCAPQQQQARSFAAPTGGGARRRRGRTAAAGEEGGAQLEDDAYVGSRHALHVYARLFPIQTCLVTRASQAGILRK